LKCLSRNIPLTPFEGGIYNQDFLKLSTLNPDLQAGRHDCRSKNGCGGECVTFSA